MGHVYEVPKAEAKAAIVSLETTGFLPHDSYWAWLAGKHDLNPTRFDRVHPSLSFIMDRNELQEKSIVDCNAPFVAKTILDKFEAHPRRFAANHSQFLVSLAKAEEYREEHPIHCNCGCTTTGTGTGITPTAAVPEPASIVMVSIAISAAWFVSRIKKR